MQSAGLKPEPAAASSDTADRILDAAEALFAVRGLNGTSVRDIARDVGVTPASLYNHFAGKIAIYEAVLERAFLPLFALMRELPAREHTEGNLIDTISAIMAELSRRPYFPLLVQHEVISGGTHMSDLARNWIGPIIEDGISELARDPDSGWREDEYGLLMSAWLNMIFGYFTMAPMLREVFDVDPLAAENLERQTRFLRKLARLMLLGRSLIRDEADGR